MKRALLLNADYAALNFVSDERAMRLVYKGRAEVLNLDGVMSVWDEDFNSTSAKFKLPATIRLLKRVNKKRVKMRFKKRILFNRDNWSCQYCSKPLGHETVTIEHIMPQSRGGMTTWKNCVTACKPCNSRKKNKTPEEANMPLLRQPMEPTALHFWDTTKSSAWHEHWTMFLPAS